LRQRIQFDRHGVRDAISNVASVALGISGRSERDELIRAVPCKGVVIEASWWRNRQRTQAAGARERGLEKRK
jgi:hypothetical protein